MTLPPTRPVEDVLPARRRRLRDLFLAAFATGAIATGGCGGGEPLPTPTDDRFDVALFREPPRELGPHVRWWWPGGAVEDATIASEVASIAGAGFGGIELQTLSFGLSASDLAADPRIRTVGEPAQLAHVSTFLREAKAHALRTSLTLGSGWPSGGTFSTDVRPIELLEARVDVVGPATVSIPVPTPAEPAWVAPVGFLFPIIGSFVPPFDLVAVVAAPIVDGSATPPVLGAPIDITASVQNGTLAWDAPSGSHAVLFVFRHRVDHLVAGDAFPNVPSPAHVIDHLDLSAARTWLDEQPSAWLGTLDPLVPDEVFVDSFELVGELPWSDAFLSRFQAEKGYSIVPFLPFVFRAAGESKYAQILASAALPAYDATDASGVRVREDYEDVRGELVLDSIVAPVASFATEHGTSFRLQGHGGYAHVLDAYARADVPESEGLFALGSTDFLELAPSAAHVEGRRIVSSESFVAISPLGPTLSEEEMWMLAGRAYTAGIQRLVYHGIAYPYVRPNGARWFPFHPDSSTGVISAGPFDITNDVRIGEADWSFLPAFNRAMTRLSYAMTRGVDRAEVAWLLDEREIPDSGLLRFQELPAEQGESTTSLALRRAGYRYDRISPSMLVASSAAAGVLQVGRASYRALLVTDWPSANPSELDAVVRALEAGVPVVVLGAMPSRARGYADAATRDASVAAIMSAMQSRLSVVPDDASIPGALASASVVPDISVRTSDCRTVSLAHRETSNGHVFLIFDEAETDCQATLDVRVGGSHASLLDPRTGARTVLPRVDEASVALASRRPMVLFVER